MEVKKLTSTRTADPIVFHVLRATAAAGARYRHTARAQAWREAAVLHALAVALYGRRVGP